MSCLDDIVRVVNESATPYVAQLVGTQDGEFWCRCMIGAAFMMMQQ